MALGIKRGGMGSVAADKWITGTTGFQKIGAREIIVRNDAGKIVGKHGVLADGGDMLMLNYMADNPVAALMVLSDGAGI